MNAMGALVGLLAASGTLIVMSRLIATRKLSLAAHIAPYVRKPDVHAPPVPSGPVTTFLALLAPLLPAQRLTDLQSRLSHAGRNTDTTAHRLEQIAFIGIGAVCGLVIGVLLLLRGSAPLGVVLLVTLGAVGGYLLHDRQLSRSIRKRRDRMSQQLPTVAELLAFAVAAGESPVQALVRISTCVNGDLSQEISEAVVDIRAGKSFEQAMRGVTARCGSVDVERFIDGLVVAMERGTPIAEVLRAQAADARASDRRRLMELAGKKDVAMLIPVVFLILPIVVLIALFPGLRGIHMFIN
jgi:tight adherence protein C